LSNKIVDCGVSGGSDKKLAATIRSSNPLLIYKHSYIRHFWVVVQNMMDDLPSVHPTSINRRYVVLSSVQPSTISQLCNAPVPNSIFAILLTARTTVVEQPTVESAVVIWKHQGRGAWADSQWILIWSKQFLYNAPLSQ